MTRLLCVGVVHFQITTHNHDLLIKSNLVFVLHFTLIKAMTLEFKPNYNHYRYMY